MVFLMSHLFAVPTTKVSFGTTLSRDLLPLKPPHTRAGNELGLRGQPNLGPGAYDNHEVISCLISIDLFSYCVKIVQRCRYFTMLIH